jgi:hypothetical protein
MRVRSRAATPELQRVIAGLSEALRAYRMEKPPSIAEMIEFERALEILGITELAAEQRALRCHSLRKHARTGSALRCRTDLPLWYGTQRPKPKPKIGGCRGGSPPDLHSQRLSLREDGSLRGANARSAGSFRAQACVDEGLYRSPRC